MGTGGTLPTNITQTVTLYNTTGVIEKDKGIYFCPFLSTQIGTGHTVRQGWIDAFKQALNYQSDSAYSNINISQWNPKDRSLVIKGNSDDFRVITEEGNCFNYLIVERSVTENSTTKVHYYAFFITDVAQAGQGSVRLELQPDDFTNVFYLHNTKERNSYSGTYVDVFNERLKNCYVARQHYNRIYRETSTFSFAMLTTGYRVVDNESTRVTYDITSQMTDPDVSVDNVKIDRYKVFVDGVEKTSNVSNIWIDKRATWYVNVLLDYVLTGNHTISINATLTQNTNVLKEDNLPIFSQIEEGFKYKRQFRDYKEYLNEGNPLSSEEKEEISEAESWSDISISLQNKILKICTGFLHITVTDKSITEFYRYSYLSNGNRIFCEKQRDFNNKLPNSDLENSLSTLVVPVVIVPDILKDYETEIKNASVIEITVNSKPLVAGTNHTEKITFLDVNSINALLSNTTTGFTNYIVNIFLTKESSLSNKLVYSNGKISLDWKPSVKDIEQLETTKKFFTDDYLHLAFMLKQDLELDVLDNPTINKIKFNSLGYIQFSLSADNNYFDVYYGDSGDSYRPLGVLFIEDFKPLSFTIDLTDNVNKNLKTEYYDTVLTFNPYSFYSISYLGNLEVPFNKQNYYDNPNIKLDVTIVATDTLKYYIIPTYEINGISQKMYNESLRLTLSSNLTIASSQLANFMIQNQAQMKNQYALNDLKKDYGLIETAVAGVGNITGGAMKGALISGGAGALAGAGAVAGVTQTVTGLITTVIDWDRDTKQIAMNQKAKLADLGQVPDNVKQVGTDVITDLNVNEMGIYLNHYTIDEVSYNSICKYLERFGYMVNIYDSLNVNTRKGWDYVQLVSFDYDDKITTEQEDSIRQILQNGVTLLHDHNVMVSGHNYEIILD